VKFEVIIMEEQERLTKLEERLKHIWKTWDELPERYGLPRNPLFDRPGGLNYNHICGNIIIGIQGYIGEFKQKGDAKNLREAEEKAQEIEIYFELLAKYQEYREAEFNGDGLFLELRKELAKRKIEFTYPSESKKRLDSQ